MSQLIDATGLPPEAVRVVESLVQMLRTGTTPRTPNQLDPVGWSARLRAFVESQPKVAAQMDDSRESIYEGRGE